MADLGTASYKKLAIPYAVEDTSRKGKSFTPDMEVASLTCLAEGERKKRGLLGGQSEKIIFVSKMHYPLWAVPWGDRCLIVDGLGLSSCRDRYARPPDIRLFIEDLRRNSLFREAFLSTLKEHAQTFKDFVSTVDVSLTGVVAGRGSLYSLLEQMKQGAFLDENAELAVIPLGLERDAALGKCEEFIQHWRQIQADIRGFQYALDVLEEERKLHERGILNEIEQMRERYAEESSRLRSAVEEKVKNSIGKKEDETAKITKASDKKLKAVAKEKERCERKLQRLDQKMILLQKKVDASKHRRNESQVARWSYELKTCQREINGIKGEIKAASRLIEHSRKESEDLVKEVEERHRRMIQQEEAKITDLTALQDLEITARKRELEQLSSESSRIKDLIRQLTEQKKSHASSLEGESSIVWKVDEPTLLYLPFYLARYEDDAKVRYWAHPPVVAMDYRGVLTTVQRAIWAFSLESRINLLLRPRSRELSEMLSSSLIGKMESDEAFEEKISEIARALSLYNLTGFKNALTRGMKELEDEGWVNSKESYAIVRNYGGI